MDWKAFLITFGVIFLAELGDKTQLTTMMLSTQTESHLSVFFGAVVALVASTLLGVLLGHFVGDLVPRGIVHLLAGAIFLVLGSLLILGRV